MRDIPGTLVWANCPPHAPIVTQAAAQRVAACEPVGSPETMSLPNRMGWPKPSTHVVAEAHEAPERMSSRRGLLDSAARAAPRARRVAETRVARDGPSTAAPATAAALRKILPKSSSPGSL